MPVPKAKPRGVEAIGATPPQHRAKGLSLAGRARSSGGGGMALKDSGKGTGVTPAAAAGTGSTGDEPLANLSNLVIGSPRPRRYVPVTAGPPPRGAGEKKKPAGAPKAPSLPRGRSKSDTPSPSGSPRSVVKKSTSSPRGSPLSKARSNTVSLSPRGSSRSPRTVQLTSSLASSSVNNVETLTSPSPDAHLGDTACSGRESGTAQCTMEESVRGSSVGEVSQKPCVTVRAGVGLGHGDVQQKPHLTAETGVGLSGGDVQQRPGLAAKTGAVLTMKTARKLQASVGKMPQKASAVGLNSGDVQQRPGLAAKTGAVLAMKTARKPRDSIGMMPRKTSAVTGLNGETRGRNNAVKSLKVDIQKERRAEKSSGRGLNVETLQKNHAVAGSKGETHKGHHLVRSGWGSNGQMLQKNHAVIGSKGKIQKEHHIKKLGRGSGGGMLQENDRKKTMQSEDLDPIVERRREEMMKQAQEAEHMIRKLNELGLGEDISAEDLKSYSAQLPCKPPPFDTSIKLDYEELDKVLVRHILYRIKYYKLTQEWRKNELHNAELEEDEDNCSLQNLEKLNCLSFDGDETTLTEKHILDCLEKEGLLEHIKSDSAFDWVFRYCSVAGLDDYQRIVLHNYGGCEYVHWDVYCKYFHDYETQVEYLDFWDKLSKQLEWMEDYVHLSGPSLTWGRILNRGASQAIKIAAGFTKINAYLARAAYMEWVDNMSIDIYVYRELDGVYFELWKRVAKLKKSFRAALDEVYKLDKFPLRQHRMKYALECDGSRMEEEFNKFTAGVPDEASEDKAREFITDAITSPEGKPKYYAHYIKRKMDVARAIGVISVASP